MSYTTENGAGKEGVNITMASPKQQFPGTAKPEKRGAGEVWRSWPEPDESYGYDIVVLDQNSFISHLSNMMALQKQDKDGFIERRELAKIGEHFSKGGMAIALVTTDNELAGCNLVSFEHDNTAHIGMLMVEETFRGQGLSSVLIKESTELAREKGAAYVTANVRINNPGGEKAFKNNGFEPVGDGVNVTDGSQHIKFGRTTSPAATPAPDVNTPAPAEKACAIG